MMIERSSLWQIFLVPYLWQYEGLYGAAHALQSQKAQAYGDTYFLR